MTAAAAAAGREAHVDTAAVRGQAAWRAGLGFGWVPQIVQLRRGDRGEAEEGDVGVREASKILSFKRKPFSSLILRTTVRT